MCHSALLATCIRSMASFYCSKGQIINMKIEIIPLLNGLKTDVNKTNWNTCISNVVQIKKAFYFCFLLFSDIKKTRYVIWKLHITAVHCTKYWRQYPNIKHFYKVPLGYTMNCSSFLCMNEPIFTKCTNTICNLKNALHSAIKK